MRELIADADYLGRGREPVGLYRAEVREGFGRHALVMLDYPAPRKNRGLIPEDTPVTFTWGWTPLDLRTFYGYVNHHEITEHDDGEEFLRVFCRGTSAILAEAGRDSWSKVTPSFIAKSVAARRGLRCVVSQGQRVLPYWAATEDETEFTMLRRLAEVTGHRFWVDGMTLYFVDPNRLVRRLPNDHAPAFEINRDGFGDTLLDLQVISGAKAPEGSAIQDVYGLDQNTGALIRSSSSQVFSNQGLIRPNHRVTYSRSVGSLQEARQINEAHAALGRWASVGAKVIGTPQIRVGRLVNLGGTAINPQHEGDWLVSGASHVLDMPRTEQYTYYTEMDLTRNRRETPRSQSAGLARAHREVPAARGPRGWQSQRMETIYV